jgi:2-dehydro-3-deoxyglucarate aldolase/4-hydroxy-2-oxoheptanedioate aldolase
MKPITNDNSNTREWSLYPSGGPGRELKAGLSTKKLMVGGMINEYSRPSLAKIYKEAGYDFLFIDYEHLFFDFESLYDTILAARAYGLPPIAKTPQLERAEVAKLLDSGVVGIQLPRTESKEQIKELISYMKFPPHGTRAIAGNLGNTDYVPVSDWRKWMKDQDEETTVIVHIETKLGYQNAEEIISTPEVDMVYVGPGDFSIEMGQPGDWTHPDVINPTKEILEICNKYNVAFGTTPANTEITKELIKKGMRFVEDGGELGFITKGAQEKVESYRKILAD